MRQVTTSSDKEKYGLKLKAVADFQILGRRLKGDFKTVLNALEGFCLFDFSSANDFS